jgi:peptidoglycan/xylan/chitin deacetylase (PgdA/CDA1 family)
MSYRFRQQRIFSKFVKAFFLLAVLAAAVFAYVENQYLVYRLNPGYIKDISVPLSQYDLSAMPQSNNVSSHSIPVLLYHGITDRNDGSDTQMSGFLDQMVALHKAGYRTISTQSLIGFVRGTAELPDKSFMITFDDGRKDSFYNSDEILKKLNYSAVMFIITDHIGNSQYYLSAYEVRRMVALGRWEIGSHGRKAHDFMIIDENNTQGHFLTNKLWLGSRYETDEEFTDRISADLAESRDFIEENFGVKAVGFAYPFGNFYQSSNCPGCTSILQKAVSSTYGISFFQALPSVDLDYQDGSIGFRRINIASNMTGVGLLKAIEGLQ